jgi:glutathione S-transferase
MKLYYAPGACSLAPHIVAREAGLPIDLVRVDLGAKKTADGGDFLEVNAKGYVPALRLDDGEVLTEAAAILQYLADRKPEVALAPASGTLQRYRLVEWLTFVSSEIHKGLGALFNPKLTDDMKAVLKDKVAPRLAWLDRQLAGRDYLMGKDFSVADAYAFTVLNWAGMLAVDLAPYANVRAYMARVAARPAVRDALRAEGLLKDMAA